jgi:hypothetical protein
MTIGHGGMACVAQEYHGDGDVNGLFCKIDNAGIIHVDEWKACYAGKEMEGLEVMRAKGRIM